MTWSKSVPVDLGGVLRRRSGARFAVQFPLVDVAHYGKTGPGQIGSKHVLSCANIAQRFAQYRHGSPGELFPICTRLLRKINTDSRHTFTAARWLGILLTPAVAVIAVAIALPFGQNGWLLNGTIAHGPTGTVVACRGDCSR